MRNNSRRRAGGNIQQAFKAEEANSAAFLEKLKKIQKQNKESKQRTVVNQHKIEWYNQMKSSLKREKQLEEELEKFIGENPNLKVTNDTDRMTWRARSAIHELEEDWAERERYYESLEQQLSEGQLAIANEEHDEMKSLQKDLDVFNKTRANEIIIEVSERSESRQGQRDYEDELFGLKDLINEEQALKKDRLELQQNLHDSIRGIKQLTQSLKLQQKYARSEVDKKGVKATQAKLE